MTNSQWPKRTYPIGYDHDDLADFSNTLLKIASSARLLKTAQMQGGAL
jgi:hypothetical protein